jgi:hypothetical protein
MAVSRKAPVRRPELSPLPINAGEVVAWTVLGGVAVLIMLAVATSDLSGRRVFGVPAFLAFAAYLVILGRRRQRYGYHLQHRIELLFGFQLVAAIVVGLLVHPFVP